MSFFASIIHDSRRHIDTPVNRLAVISAKSDATYPASNNLANPRDKAAPLATNEHSEVESYQQPSEPVADALPQLDNPLKVESKSNHSLATNKKKLAEQQSATQDSEGIQPAHGQFNTEPTALAQDAASPSPSPSTSTVPSSHQVSEKLDHELSAMSQQSPHPLGASNHNSVNQGINDAQSENMQHEPEIEAQKSILSSNVGPIQQIENVIPLAEQNFTTLDAHPKDNHAAKKEPVNAEYLLQKSITNLSQILPSADNAYATAGQDRSPNVGSASRAPQVKIGQMNVIVEGPVVTQPIASKSAVDNSSRTFLRSL